MTTGAVDRARRPWLVWSLLAGVFILLRVPSLLEPNWYADEGTYADIGRSLTHGAVLYRDVWDNKPPGIYWLAAALIGLAGPAAPVFHGALAAIIAGGAAAVWRLGRRLGGVAAATVATLLFVVMMSLPNLDGDLLNAEVAGAVLVLWAMALLATGAPSRWRRGGAGVLVGAAMLFKPVFALDALAVAAVPSWLARSEGRPPWRAAAAAVPMVIGASALFGLVITVLAVQGSASGLADVLVHQDVDYVQLTNGPGGSVVHAAGVATRAVSTALILLRTGLPLLAGGLLAIRWARRHRPWDAAVAWWLGCDVAGAMVSARGLTHYAQQAEGVLALAAALVAVHLWRRGGVARQASLLVALSVWPIVECMLLVPRVEVALANRDPFPPLEHHNFRAAQLMDYYSASWRRLTGTGSGPGYDAMFPYNGARMRSVVSIFQEHSRGGDRVFIWGSIHWAYALGDRIPAGRYVSLNDAYYVDPGSQNRLVAEVTARPPAVLVVDAPLPPEVVALVRRLHYRRIPALAAGDDVWLAQSAP